MDARRQPLGAHCRVLILDRRRVYRETLLKKLDLRVKTGTRDTADHDEFTTAEM
jgi:hypothetical protein